MHKIILIIFLLFISLKASEYEQWLHTKNQQYTRYKKDIDDNFSKILQSQWQEFKLFSISAPYTKPKNEKLPIIKKEKKIQKKDILKSPKVIIKTKYEKILPDIKVLKPIERKNNFLTIKFSFYGQDIIINYDKKTLLRLDSKTKSAISSYWYKMSKTDYKPLLLQINKIINELALNGWAKYQLIHQLGYSIYKDKNLTNLFSWFILSKLGYDTKVGFDTKYIYLLARMQHQLYQVMFFTLDNKKYYVLDLKTKKPTRLYSYKLNYPQADKKLSFSIDKPIRLEQNIAEKTLYFVYHQKKYKIKTKYSKSLIEFYKTFPQSDYKVYFNSATSPILSETLLKQLKLLIDGKTELEAVNILLRFTQTAFKYQTDAKQFGYEKVLFPQETIYYNYSDCEDRSIMFAFLVKNLLHLKIIGIKYNNHLATAVNLSTKIIATTIKYNGKNYTICDPTYINANVGMSMPQYKNAKFEIIN